MAKVLVFAEHFEGSLKKSNLAVIGFARQASAGGEVHALLAGSGIKGLAENLNKYDLAGVHVADDEKLANYTAEMYAELVVKAVNEIGADMVCCAASTTGKDMMPRVAAKLQAGMVSDVMGVEDNLYKSPMWAGNAIAFMEVTTPKKVFTVRTTEFDPAQEGGAGPVSDVTVDFDAGVDKKFVEFKKTESDRPDLTEASVVVSGGRGLKGEEGFKMLEPLADIFNAAIGATRAAVDAGWVPNDLQVGQTGKIVAPDLYFAIALSGAIQHLAGMKGSKTIVAVNKDPEAPICAVADYYVVADAFKAVPELVEEIKKAKAS